MGTQQPDFTEFYRQSKDACLFAVLVSVGDWDVAQDLVDEAFAFSSARGTGTIRTAAFTLVEHANGTATLTINLHELIDAAALQNDLQQYGVPALVTSGSFCSSHPAPAGFSQVVSVSPYLRQLGSGKPAAMPAGTELSFGVFQLGPARSWPGAR